MIVTDLAQDVGFLKGQQEAMRGELTEIKDDMKVVTQRLGDQDKTMSRIEGKIDGMIAAQKATDKHPIKAATSACQSSSIQTSVVKRVLRWPSLPWVICIVAILLIAIVCIAALTGRHIGTFLPTVSAG